SKSCVAVRPDTAGRFAVRVLYLYPAFQAFHAFQPCALTRFSAILKPAVCPNPLFRTNHLQGFTLSPRQARCGILWYFQPRIGHRDDRRRRPRVTMTPSILGSSLSAI